MYGAKITGAEVDGSLQGVNFSMGKQYMRFVASTTGNTPVNIFGSGSAPVAGTVIGFFVTNLTTVAGTAVLWGTTAGTIASVAFLGSATNYVTSSTFVLAGAVAAGDTLQVSSFGNTGTAACYVDFISPN